MEKMTEKHLSNESESKNQSDEDYKNELRIKKRTHADLQRSKRKNSTTEGIHKFLEWILAEMLQ